MALIYQAISGFPRFIEIDDATRFARVIGVHARVRARANVGMYNIFGDIVNLIIYSRSSSRARDGRETRVGFVLTIFSDFYNSIIRVIFEIQRGKTTSRICPWLARRNIIKSRDITFVFPC